VDVIFGGREEKERVRRLMDRFWKERSGVKG